MSDKEVLEEFMKFFYDDKGSTEIKVGVKRYIEEAQMYLKNVNGGSLTNLDTTMLLLNFRNYFSWSDDKVISLSNYYLLMTIKDFLSDSNFLFMTFEKLKYDKNFWDASKKIKYVYTSNREENQKKFAHDIFYNNFNCGNNKFSREEIMNIPSETKEELIENVKKYVGAVKKALLSDMSTGYVNGIINSVKILDQLGSLGRLIKQNNKGREFADGTLNFEYEKNEESKEYAVKQLMDKEFLSKLPIEQLMALHSVYSNRVKKITSSIGKGLFIMEKLGKIDDFSEADYEKAVKLFYRYQTIENIYKSIVGEIYKDIGKYASKDKYSGKRFVAVDPQLIYETFFQKYSRVYDTIFDGNDELPEDFDKFITSIVADYTQKDFATEILIIHARENFQKINWGYIPEEINCRNSIERKSEFILLGFDIPGLNMPLRLHMPIARAKDAISSIDKDKDIPCYIGDEDFSPDGRNIGASILMPLSKSHKAKLEHFFKGMKSQWYYKFVQHIVNMQQFNNLTKIQKAKGISDRRWINLDTGMMPPSSPSSMQR